MSPFGPFTTSSIASGVGTQDSTTSHCLPMSAGDLAGTPPAFSKSASDPRRYPSTRKPLLMRFSQIGRPILPTPMKPTVSIPAPNVVAWPSRDVERLVREVHRHPERALHHGPFAHLETAQLVDDERIGGCDPAGIFRAV